MPVVVLVAGCFTMILGIPFLAAKIDQHCDTRHEAYLECVKNTQNREKCAKDEEPWYCG